MRKHHILDNNDIQMRSLISKAAFGEAGHLFEEKVEHENETGQIHVVILAVQVQGAVSGGVTQVPEGAAAQRAPERAPERAGKWAQCVVLAPAARIRHHAHLWADPTHTKVKGEDGQVLRPMNRISVGLDGDLF